MLRRSRTLSGGGNSEALAGPGIARKIAIDALGKILSNNLSIFNYSMGRFSIAETSHPCRNRPLKIRMP